MFAHLRAHKTAWLITFVYGVVFCLISLVNHYHFRTYGLDLGIYTHGIYSYAHLNWHTFTLGLEGVPFNHLGNHFSPIVMLISPLYYFFGTYTLLIVQVAALLFGGWGVYRFAEERLSRPYPALILLLFFSMWGIYSALAYDWHANVMAAMFVPWFILFFGRGEMRKAWVFFGLILLCKENMALWMVFILLGMMLKQLFIGVRPFPWKAAVGMTVFSVGYFSVVQGIVMPYFNPLGLSDHLGNYSHLGDGPMEVLRTILTKPRHVFYLMTESLQPDPNTFMVKNQLHFMVLVSGGLALIYRPHYLIMLAPIYAQKLLSSDPKHWGVYAHYSIEFAPIIAMAFTEWIRRFPFPKLKLPLLLGTIAAATFFNWHPVKPNTDFFRASHYRSGLETDAIHQALDAVPDGAAVSASNVLIPHLADREKIYLFPVVNDAEYIVLLKEGRQPYPLSESEFQEQLGMWRDQAEEIIHDRNGLLIVKRVVTP